MNILLKIIITAAIIAALIGLLFFIMWLFDDKSDNKRGYDANE